MKQPFWWAVSAGAAILLVAFAPTLWQSARPPSVGEHAAAMPQGLPWQTEVAADGALQVFGLAVGRDTLARVEQQLADGLQVALVARLGEPPVLEGLVDPHRAGFVSGRLVLAFEVDPAEARRWQSRSPRSSPMEGGVRRFELEVGDWAAARGSRLLGLSFVPVAQLDEGVVRQRFGPPESTLGVPGLATALLYPARGLVVTVAAGQRSVLQYVAPRDFDARLRVPLATSASH
jgi:hypothetical protein